MGEKATDRQTDGRTDGVCHDFICFFLLIVLNEVPISKVKAHMTHAVVKKESDFY